MKAVILCGGQGTRIRDANELLPKPMLPIGGKPIVWHIMKMYARHGVKEFVLCLGYKGWLIKEFFLNYKAMTTDLTVTLGQHGAVELIGRTDEEDWRVTLAETGEETMTGGRVAAVRKYVEGDEPFLLTPTATACRTWTWASRSRSTRPTARWRPSPPSGRPAASARW
jgi:glucose-1-phosphate cytidylyltransferase